MKKLLLAISLIILCKISFAQTNGSPLYPINQNVGNAPTTMVNVNGLKINGATTFGFFADTILANQNQFAKNYAFGYIQTLGGTWQRNYNATRWIFMPTNDIINGITGCYKLIRGGIVTWSGSGLIMDVSPADYAINCTYYHSPQSQVTLATADPSLPRIDLIYADTNNVVGVLTGTPNATPIIPQVNSSSQIQLTAILVPAAATTPSGVSQTVVYDENTEWTSSSTMLSGSVNFNSTSSPFHLVKNAVVSANSRGNLLWTNSSALSTTNYTSIKLYIKIEAPFLVSPSPLGYGVGLFKNGSSVTASQVIDNYGFNQHIFDTYQVITIPLSDFVFNQNTTQGSFDAIGIKLAGLNVSAIHIDYVQLQAGIATGSSNYITDVYRRKGTDSVFYVKNGVSQFAFIDSTNGGGGGGGTVTSVSGLSPIFTVSNPTGAATFSLSNVNPYNVFRRGSGTGVPSYGTLDTNYIPNFSTYVRPLLSAGTGITYNSATGVITNSSPSTGGTVTSVASGNGMNFSTITGTGTVTLGTPSSVTLASTNSLTSNSHTHAFVPGGTTLQYIRGDGTLATLPTYTFNNGLTNAGGLVQLGGTLLQNTTIDGSGFNFTLNNSPAITFTATNGSGTGGVVFRPDSISFTPPLGKMNIDSLRSWSLVSDTTYKKVMTWDTRNGRLEYSNWFGSGGGSAPDFFLRNTGTTGDSLLIPIASNTAGIKKLIAGTNVTFTIADSSITINSSGGGGTPAGNFGNLQINRNSLFATPASDSLTFSGGLSVKGTGTFTGLVTVPTSGLRINATTVTSTGTQLNYLNAATGTTGTTSTNLVFSTSPLFTTPRLASTSTTGYVWTATDGSGNGSFQAPTGGVAVSVIDSMQWIDVNKMGALPDDGIDDTPIIQAALDSAHNGTRKTVYFRRPGIYNIDGALQTSVNSVNPNCQLYIPLTDNSSTEYPRIKILGSTPPHLLVSGFGGTSQVNSGVVLKSGIIGSGTKPSVIGSPWFADTFGPLNNTSFDIENITIQTRTKTGSTHIAPTMTHLNLSYPGQVTVNNVKLITQSDASTSVTAVGTGTVGIILPIINNRGINQIGLINISDCDTAIAISEHFYGENLFVGNCNVGVAVRSGYHGNHINSLSVESSAISIAITTSQSVSVSMYQTEHNAGGAWYDFVRDVNFGVGSSGMVYSEHAQVVIGGSGATRLISNYVSNDPSRWSIGLQWDIMFNRANAIDATNPGMSFLENYHLGFTTANSNNTLLATGNYAGALFRLQNNNASGYSNIQWADNAGTVQGYLGILNSSAGDFNFDNGNGAGTFNFLTNNLNRFKINFNGSLTAPYIPVGGVAADSVLVIDASGNLKKRNAAAFSGGGGGGTPAGNYGNIQLNRNGLFDTPATDTLSYSTGGGLSIKNGISIENPNNNYGISLATPGTARGRFFSLNVVSDWVGTSINSSFNGSGWVLDNTSENGGFFKLDSRTTQHAVAIYGIPTGSGTHTDEFQIAKFDISNGDFTVGPSDQFKVNASGNITKLNNVTTSFPSSNSAGVLTNNGSGTLTWAAASTPTLQQVITSGSTLSSSNTINAGATSLTFTNNSLAGVGTLFSSTSTAAASNAHIILGVDMTGANSNSNQLTRGFVVQNQKTGTGSINLAGDFYSTGGATNYAIRLRDGTEGNGKVLTSDASGYASWQTPSGTTYTFSTGLTNTSSTITNNLSTGVSGGQTLIGSTSTNSGLTIKATTGVGTTGANITFTGGNNGATTLATMLHGGQLRLNQYGGGSFANNSPVYGLAVDGSGNVVEAATPVVVAGAETPITATGDAISYTTPNDGLIHVYNVSANLNVASISSSSLVVTVVYTDDGGVSRTITFFPMGATTSGVTTTGVVLFPVMGELRCNPNTAITVTVTKTGGTVSSVCSTTLVHLRTYAP